MNTRNLMTTVAMILTLGVATPALADGSQNHGFGTGQTHGQIYDGASRNDRGNVPAFANNQDRYLGAALPRRDVGDWEHTWGPWQGERLDAHETLPRWQLVRRLEAQGYHNATNLTPGRFGNGWRAFAFYRHSPVVVRLDPFSGRVLAARYV